MWKGIVNVLCFLLIFLTFENVTVYAHKMLVENLEPGTFHVRYDDGTNASLATVIFYDNNGNELLRGQVDEEGIITYDKSSPIYSVVADDGLGHRATWVESEQDHILSSIPLLMRAFLGISLLLFIAALFAYRRSKSI